MKLNSIFLFVSLLCFSSLLQAQVAGDRVEWAFIKGDQAVNKHGIYGTMGVSDTANLPGSRVVAQIWTDKEGKFWMYGGEGRGESGNVERLNDLWKYDPATNEWTWMGGEKSGKIAGVYGQKGISDPANMPGGRSHGATWVDTAGNLWLYGGLGFGAGTASSIRLNDFWKYDIVSGEWTWMGGDNVTTVVSAKWGQKKVPDTANNPGSRSHMISWTDKDGKFWLFGGYHAAAPVGYLNDLWRYDPATNEWTWMKGNNNTAGLYAVYGVVEVEDSNSTPGGVTAAFSWAGNDGMLYFFGGYGHAASGGPNTLNALWRYNPVTNNWTFMKGNKQYQSVDDLFGDPHRHTPAASYTGISWKDRQGRFWIYGGYNSNGNSMRSNLWRYDPVLNEWKFIKGPGLTLDEPRLYGVRGVPDEQNTPGARYNLTLQTGWTDTAGNFWLFGGSLPAANQHLSDLWRLSPVNINCAFPTPNIITSGATAFCQGDSVILRGAVPGSGLGYRWMKDNIVLNGETNDSLVVRSAGSYRVEVSDGSCADTSASAVITVNGLPAAAIAASGPVAFCEGGSVTLTASPTGAGFSYQWLKDGATAGNTTHQHQTGISGDYRVVVTNSNNCSDTSATTTVIAHPLPVVSLGLSGPPAICQGGSVILDAGTGTGWSYAWKQDNVPAGGNTATYTATATGTYHVTVTDGNNCSDTASQAVQVYPRPSVFVTPADTAFCEGNNAVLQSVTTDTALSYQWKDDNGIINNATSSFLQVMQPGNYYVVAGSQYAGNCTDSSNIAVVTVHPKPAPVIDWNGSELSTQPGYTSYQWYIDGQAINGATDSIWRAVNGDYIVEVTDSNGCTNMSDIFPVTNAGLTGDNATSRLIKVYPNPVTAGVIHIISPVTVQVTLMSMDGRSLQQQKDTVIDISRFPDGVYMLRITDEKGHFIRHECLVKKAF